MSEENQLETVQTLKLQLSLPQCLSTKKETVEIETTLDETLPQLKETLGLIPKTENLTNLLIFYKDVNLFEAFDEMSTFRDVLKQLGLEGSQSLSLRLAEKPYNLANVYEHLLKFRQVIGLHFLDKSKMDFGVSGGVSKFSELGLDAITTPQVPKEPEQAESTKSKESTKKEEEEEEEIVLSSEQKAEANKLAESLSKSGGVDILSLGSFQNPFKDFKLPIKHLTISQWSPVPQYQKIQGDLLYLSLQTLENETFQITAHFSGFFVNKSSSTTFNPQIKHSMKSNKHFILFDLISGLSPLFEKTLIANSSNLHSSSSNPETYLIPTSSFVNHPWLVGKENITNNADLTQNQLPILVSGVDGGELVRDWNDEFQSIKELPRSTVNERILREKLISKTIYEFNKVATETAINIVNGNITSLNISEDPELLTFLRNGVFYSFGVDATGNFVNSGGDDAARYTTGKDLNAVKILNRIDSSDVHNLLTLVVDYMGKRIICQAPVPGIFQETRNIETDEVFDKVVYGLNSDNSQIVYNKNFNDALKTISEAFHLKPHSIELDDGVKSKELLITSKDMKGIHGTDGRKYMIDLYRTTPLDIGFIEKHFQPEKDTSYPHKETLVRHEALEEWWKRKIAVLIKLETEKLEKEGKTFDKENGEKPQLLIQGDQVSINSDAFTGINESEEDRNDVREVSKFVLTLVEEFLNEMGTQLAPFDGSHLTSMLHRSGINLRYLGYIADQCLERKQKELQKIEEQIKSNEALAEQLAQEEKEKVAKGEEQKEEENLEETKEEEKSAGIYEPIAANYETIYKLSVQEMVARATKHVLRKLSKSLPVNLMSTFVSHFLNCLLGSNISVSPMCFIDENLKTFYSFKDLQFTSLTSNDAIELVTKEVFIRFRFQLPSDWVNTLIKPYQLFREISLKFGIQWKAQNYSFTKEEFELNKESMVIEAQVIENNVVSKKNKKGKKQSSPVIEKVITRQSIFIADDILNFSPLVKDSSYKPALFDEVLETARIELKNDQQNGLMLFNELLSFHEQVYGRVHTETSSYYGYLSQLYSELNFPYEASTLARVSCILSERVTGFDSYNSITAYVNSAFFESSNKDYINSLKLYSHAIRIWTSIYGEDHPSFITTFANLGEIFTKLKLFDASKKLFEKSIELSTKLNGEISDVTGLIKYRYGYSLLSADSFKGAKVQFENSYNIFVKALGPKDLFTVKSLSYATNLKTWLDYQNHEKSKKQSASKAKAPASTAASKSKKNKKNQNAPKIDEEIASKSVDDIMAFIEGSNKKKA
ncbi:Intracellular distribution of mitochondria [Yamadazyma tenuis]|uniref:Clustered mitochondria protein homolog n=1 Tax=Candida tenuis (strain ATCC 10573 / BCRC 21748 / CBS 615 / JCM 9827 / NBRC 10315 / NRRL Y-1498 / VKM Y-70) TaxID=590646 RepID=G3AYU5_CANTC|nr:uncharacterized protein CANTEDRAFT_97005 [Yamadazyma tenuis ATCC 10573]EGV65931.1 hypothetical protein CANTEDRAFT_97005 [Yamadazyma tenuis ATCC 10573]WEJ95737.1 Intracellular distribution of mitochondria [Yamadazyma tenuis]